MWRLLFSLNIEFSKCFSRLILQSFQIARGKSMCSHKCYSYPDKKNKCYSYDFKYWLIHIMINRSTNNTHEVFFHTCKDEFEAL